MASAIDPTTLALTGQLPFILLLATVLALLSSVALLRLYKRAVLRSMRLGTRGQEAQQRMPAPVLERPPLSPALYSHLHQAPHRAAAAYALGGFAFSLVMTAAFLIAGKIGFLPVRFLLLLWSFAWPVVLTTNLVLGSVRRTILLSTAVYFLVFGALGAIGIARSPELDWTQVVVFWLVSNGPPTVLLLAFLNRRVRAVGPLVLLFMVLAVTGATLVVSLTGSHPTLMRAAVNVGSAIGLSALGILAGLYFVGFLLFGMIGWLTLLWMRSRYEKKKVSDESITFDAIWLLFGVVHSIGLVFEGVAWIVSGLVAFASYKVVSRLALSVLGRRAGGRRENARLLLLRVFALGKRSERMFDVLGSYWRHIGSIQLIAGPDLVTKTVEPHEFLDFLSGKLARRFIDGPEALVRRLSEMDIEPDHDGRFRVNDFFCHDHTWRAVLSRLVNQSDAILMDLRSFSAQNEGVAFELEELMNLVPLERVVFVIDDTTSEPYLNQVVQQIRDRLRPDSPNRSTEATGLRVLRFKGVSGELQDLLRALSTAAKSSPKAAVVGVAAR